jgi:hypothetical protein
MSVNENYIENEVRVRLLQEIAKDTKDTLKEMRIEIRETKKHLEDKIDSHFKWTLGTILLLIITVITFMATVVFK